MQSYSYSSGGGAALPLAVILAIALVALAVAAFSILAWCLIFRRAGYSWALGLLMLVPVANIIAFLVLAFSKWPVQRELEDMHAALGARGANAQAVYAPPIRPPVS